MTIQDMYVEWIDFQNTEMTKAYTEANKIYIQQSLAYNIMRSNGAEVSSEIEPPAKPNYWFFDSEKYKAKLYGSANSSTRYPS